ncbi:AMP-binding enzyme [Lentzea albidocapillata]|uniref:AMP-binding enzyme n=2 Tax=Lentzea albidocapillata TaxID=40571 RepID=A0A1W2CVK9_9PSEU|nr:AMP-binding enzyme [Lentzea albidocapillata]
MRQARLVAEELDAVTAVPPNSVDAAISRLAEASPRAIAVVDGTHRLSYAELDGYAWHFADRVRALDLADDAVAGVRLSSSWHLVVALIGTLRAGAVTVPMPSHALSIEDPPVVDVLSGLSVTSRPAGVAVWRDKGSAVTRGRLVTGPGLHALTSKVADELALTSGDVVLTTADTADPSVFEEIVPVLLRGGTVALAQDDRCTRDVAVFLDHARASKATVVTLRAQAWSVLAGMSGTRPWRVPATVRLVIVTGAGPVSNRNLDLWRRRHGIPLLHVCAPASASSRYLADAELDAQPACGVTPDVVFGAAARLSRTTTVRQRI